jgi:hypothetical protein
VFSQKSLDSRLRGNDEFVNRRRLTCRIRCRVEISNLGFQTSEEEAAPW